MRRDVKLWKVLVDDIAWVLRAPKRDKQEKRGVAARVLRALRAKKLIVGCDSCRVCLFIKSAVWVSFVQLGNSWLLHSVEPTQPSPSNFCRRDRSSKL